MLLILVTSCNIFDVDTKKLEFGTWDDFPNFDFPPPQPHPYISNWEVEPFPRFPGDSLTITCMLHDTLDAADYTFKWDLNHFSALPEGVAEHNRYKTIAPDSAGTYWIGIYIHSDSTYSDTLDYDSIGIIVEENPD